MQKIASLNPICILTRPKTLDNGKEYYLRVRQANGSYPTYIPIKFIDYDPCPALVLITQGDGHIWRAAREDLFTTEAAIQ